MLPQLPGFPVQRCQDRGARQREDDDVVAVFEMLEPCGQHASGVSAVIVRLMSIEIRSHVPPRLR